MQKVWKCRSYQLCIRIQCSQSLSSMCIFYVISLSMLKLTFPFYFVIAITEGANVKRKIIIGNMPPKSKFSFVTLIALS